MTLDMRSLRTITTITVHRNHLHSSPNLSNSISLNHNPPIPFNKRITNVINAIHQYLNHHRIDSAHNILNDLITIKSVNDFPTAAGLASSASGYAALAKGLCTLYGITDDKGITCFARIGSGSASRSIHSGFVKWFASNDSNDSNDLNPKTSISTNSEHKIDDEADPFGSFAEQLCDEKHWSDLRVIICVASSREKE